MSPSATHVLHFGISKPLIDAGVTTHFHPVRIPGNTDLASLDAVAASQIRAIAVGSGHAPVGQEQIEALPNLEIIARFGVGYDHIDVAAAARRGIVVTNTPDILTEDVADIALTLFLSTVRQTTEAERFLRAGRWRSGEFMLTSSLRERSAGIVGLGRIGRAIAHRLAAFSVPVSYFGRQRQSVDLPYYADIMQLAEAVDALIIAAPGGAATRHLINADVLAALGPTGIVVNVGRGSIVDEAALADAVTTGAIAGAGLDVYEHEPDVPKALLDSERTVLLPHIASATRFTRDAMAQMVVDNLVSWFAGKGPMTPVPETPFNGYAVGR